MTRKAEAGDIFTCRSCKQLPDCQAAYGEPWQDGTGCADWEMSTRTAALDELIASTADQYGDIEP